MTYRYVTSTGIKTKEIKNCRKCGGEPMMAKLGYWPEHFVVCSHCLTAGPSFVGNYGIIIEHGWYVVKPDYKSAELKAIEAWNAQNKSHLRPLRTKTRHRYTVQPVLKRCPFCGKEADVVPYKDIPDRSHCRSGWYACVSCRGCGVSMREFDWSKIKAEICAAWKWNRRAKP